LAVTGTAIKRPLGPPDRGGGAAPRGGAGKVRFIADADSAKLDADERDDLADAGPIDEDPTCSGSDAGVDDGDETALAAAERRGASLLRHN